MGGLERASEGQEALWPPVRNARRRQKAAAPASLSHKHIHGMYVHICGQIVALYPEHTAHLSPEVYPYICVLVHSRTICVCVYIFTYT